jgi:hypothetical protein
MDKRCPSDRRILGNYDKQLWGCNIRTGGLGLRQNEVDNEQLRIKGPEKLRRDIRLAVA